MLCTPPLCQQSTAPREEGEGLSECRGLPQLGVDHGEEGEETAWAEKDTGGGRRERTGEKKERMEISERNALNKKNGEKIEQCNKR